MANLENYINKILVWSESLVSWCADFTRFSIQVMNQWRFGFFEEKARGYEDQLSWVASSLLVAWTCLVCLKAGPTLFAVALLIGQIKELTQYWVSWTNQSKGDLSFGQVFKPPRQAQANRLGKGKSAESEIQIGNLCSTRWRSKISSKYPLFA